MRFPGSIVLLLALGLWGGAGKAWAGKCDAAHKPATAPKNIIKIYLDHVDVPCAKVQGGLPLIFEPGDEKVKHFAIDFFSSPFTDGSPILTDQVNQDVLIEPIPGTRFDYLAFVASSDAGPYRELDPKIIIQSAGGIIVSVVRAFGPPPGWPPGTPQPVSVVNNSSAQVEIGVSLIGSDTFKQDGLCNNKVLYRAGKSGAACLFHITFTPNGPAAQEGKLEVSRTPGPFSPVARNLSGTPILKK